MAIDLSHEQLITFAELARSLPRRRRNRPVHIATIHRWRSRGLGGIRLEAIRIGGAWHTSWESFQRFCHRLTAAEPQSEQDIVDRNSNRTSHAKADKALERGRW